MIRLNGHTDAMPEISQLLDHLRVSPMSPVEKGRLLFELSKRHLVGAQQSSSLSTVVKELLDGAHSLLGADAIQTDASSKFVYCLILHRAANSLANNSQYTEAASLLKNLLALDANDPLCARYDLPLLLGATGAIKEARAFEERYRETSAVGLYNLAFLDALEGSPEFVAHAVAASLKNTYIAPLLLGERKLPRKRSRQMYEEPLAPGTFAEAAWYVRRNRALWEGTHSGRTGSRTPLDQLKSIAHQLQRKNVRKKSGGVLNYDAAENIRSELLTVNFASRRDTLGLLVRIARLLFDRQPWVVCNETPVFIALAGRDEPVIAQFSGALGNLKGAFVYTDRASFDFANGAAETADESPLEYPIGGGLAAWASESLWITLEDIRALDPFVARELKEFQAPSYGSVVPAPLMKRRGFMLWRATEEELAIGLLALFGLSRMALKPPRQGMVREICLTSEDAVGKLFIDQFEVLKQQREISKVPKDLGKYAERLSRDFRDRSRLGASWEIGFVSAASVAQPNAFSRPAGVLACLVVDSQSGRVINATLESGDVFVPRLAAKALTKAVSEAKYAPKSLKFQTSPFDQEIDAQLGALCPVEFTSLCPNFRLAAMSIAKRITRADNGLEQ